MLKSVTVNDPNENTILSTVNACFRVRYTWLIPGFIVHYRSSLRVLCVSSSDRRNSQIVCPLVLGFRPRRQTEM